MLLLVAREAVRILLDHKVNDEKNAMVAATHPMISIPELKSEIPQPPHAAVPNDMVSLCVASFINKKL